MIHSTFRHRVSPRPSYDRGKSGQQLPSGFWPNGMGLGEVEVKDSSPPPNKDGMSSIRVMVLCASLKGGTQCIPSSDSVGNTCAGCRSSIVYARKDSISLPIMPVLALILRLM